MFQAISAKFSMYHIGACRMLKEQILDRHKSLPMIDENEEENERSRVAVITGGNRGIGYHVVLHLLKKGYTVILGTVIANDQFHATYHRSYDDMKHGFAPSNFFFLGCRETEESKKKFDLRDKTDYPGKCMVFKLDLMDIASVRAFADNVLKTNTDTLDLLINNAGIMFGDRKLSADGIESQFLTNYLSHFLLTSLLFPKLKASGTPERKSRIVNVSSEAHRLASNMDIEDLTMEHNYTPEGAYGCSKAAQIMFTKLLHSKLKDAGINTISVFSLHPGVILTDLYVNVAWVKMFRFLAQMVMKTPAQGAETVLYTALSPELEDKGGSYIDNSQLGNPIPFTCDVKNQETLWKKTLEILKMDKFTEEIM